MNCEKCGKQTIALYGIPRPIGRFLNDPRAPKWCYECYAVDYGTDEERDDLQREEQLAIDRAIEADIDFKEHKI